MNFVPTHTNAEMLARDLKLTPQTTLVLRDMPIGWWAMVATMTAGGNRKHRPVATYESIDLVIQAARPFKRKSRGTEITHLIARMADGFRVHDVTGGMPRKLSIVPSLEERVPVPSAD